MSAWTVHACMCMCVWSPVDIYQLSSTSCQHMVETPSLRHENFGATTHAHSTSTCLIIKSCWFPLQYLKQFYLKSLRARICLNNVNIWMPSLTVLGRLLASHTSPGNSSQSLEAQGCSVQTAEKGREKCGNTMHVSGCALGCAWRKEEALPGAGLDGHRVCRATGEGLCSWVPLLSYVSDKENTFSSTQPAHCPHTQIWGTRNIKQNLTCFSEFDQFTERWFCT